VAKLADESSFSGRFCDDEEGGEIGEYGTTWMLLARKE